MHRYLKRTLIGLCIVLVVFFTAGIVTGNFFYNLAINPHGDKTTVNEAAAEQISFDLSNIDVGRDWMDTLGYKETHIQSFDGLRLQAYVLDNPDADTWVIQAHGYGGNARQLAFQAMHFYEMGYSVLMPNARGHGQSEGDYMGMGWHDRWDMLDWIDFLNTWRNDINIVLYGVSMGGTTVMMTSGENLPSNVVAIIEDCGYTSVWDEFSFQLRDMFGLPPFPVLYFASLVTQLRAGYWLSEGSAIEQVGKSITPTLFIHGSDDEFVPAYMATVAYDACTAEKELLIIENAGHGASSMNGGAIYWDTVEAFITLYTQ